MFFEKMQNRKNDGFTLVELIVVIAILAILAGIAVPAYSGYIEKANVAADEQLLHAVNIAFLSAAAEHAGGTVRNASLTYGGTTGAVTVTGVASVSSSGTPNMEALKTAFNTYYGTNNTAAFKTYSALYFNPTLGMFAADVVETYSYAGGTVALSKSDVQALANSPFVQNMPNGIEGLLAKVDAVMDFGAGLIEGGTNSFASLANSPVFLNSLAKSLGIEGLDFEVLMAKDPSTWTEAEQKALQEYGAKTGAIQADRLAALKEQAKAPSSPYYGKDDEYLNTVAGNQMLSTNAVLYAAQNSTTTKDELMSILKVTESNTNPKKALTDNMGGDMGKGLSQASAAYGLYTAYVYSLPDDYVNPETKQTKAQMISATSNPVDILNGLGDSGFQAYLNTAEAGDAFDAYMSAMDMINSSSQSPEAVSGVLTDGFSDKELAELFNQAIK